MDRLTDLRRQIDEIDTQIHDLLMKRTEVTRSIGANKGEGAVYLRPGREAQVVRRLKERHHGELPFSVVQRIWREIFAGSTRLQGNLAVAVYAADNQQDLWNLAREHFGMLTPIHGSETIMGALRQVADGRASVGVLPLPQSDDPKPWWTNLARGGENVARITAKLPFFRTGQMPEKTEAVIVALGSQEETGHDRSYVVFESDEPFSRGTLKSMMAKCGLESVNIHIYSPAGEPTLHLVEVEGFVAPGDKRMTQLSAQTDLKVDVWTIGGYAIPLTEG